MPAVKNAIPARLNLVLLAGAALGNIGLLYLASHPANGWVLAGAVVAFSFLNNTIFSLLHESVHQIFHPNRRVPAITIGMGSRCETSGTVKRPAGQSDLGKGRGPRHILK